MTRILSLDWGTKRIGAAISDELNIIATAFQKPLEAAEVFHELAEIISKNQVTKIIVGLPVNLKNQDSSSTIAARKFIAQLKKRFKLDVFEVDERFSSVEALKKLQNQKRNMKKSRMDKDCLSAQILLENFLTKQKSNE
jgi:putative Holliday junction resolvase